MAVVLALVAGCSGGQVGRTGAGVADATVRISASGQKVRPDQGVTVTASGGTLLTVTGAVGRFSADRTSWRTTWTLKPGNAYKVTATAKNTKGKVSTVSGTFRTE
jgi:hypothetical protein